MKYLVENKPRIEEDNEIRMNPRCSALLQNHLPPKEQDPGSFILPCSIGKLDFKNALADLGATISIMPFFMYKLLEVGSEKVIFKMRSSFTTANFESVRSIKSKTFIEDENLKEIDYDLFLHDSESWVIHDKLSDDWFNNTSEDEDNLEGILDYLRSYDGFIDLDDEAYNKRRCKLLRMTFEEPNPILIEKAKVTRYIIGTGETYTKVKVLGVEKIPRTRDNVAAMRPRLMKKVAQEGNN
ncbi:hypothetical protein Tco_0626999 [Tanacetum coccineum]|uniref:Uncharacterized protein n=1 Tax=Tanacetum coccineum TaxID=301880 RepID=A0ABQ4WL93_9ASTR